MFFEKISFYSILFKITWGIATLLCDCSTLSYLLDVVLNVAHIVLDTQHHFANDRHILRKCCMHTPFAIPFGSTDVINPFTTKSSMV